MNIIGLSAFYHDSAASLVIDGDLIAAAQEERFSRVKNDSQFPLRSLLFCLSKAQLQLKDIDCFVFYEKPFLKFERLMETYLNEAPLGFTSFQKAFPLWIKEKLFQKKLIGDYLREIDPGFRDEKKILFNDHHMSHTASAFYPSPFEQSAVLTMDGVGEWATTTIGLGKGSQLEILKEIRFPHSLGLFYSSMTSFCGFKVNSGEYKLMGLAPFGEPKYVDIIRNKLIDLKEDGSFSLNLDYFNYTAGLTMTALKMEELFNIKPRKWSEDINPVYRDIAASTQKVLEAAVLNLVSSMDKEQKNLCLAGGVALNCVANAKIKKHSHFEKIWIQPAAGDAGGSVGAALSAWHLHFKKPRNKIKSQRDGMKGCQLGPHYRQDYIEENLKKVGAVFSTLSQQEIMERTVDSLKAGHVVGWFQGPMEFGPRALGHRSILADPRRVDMQKNLNLKIKNRESFRPFAPAVLNDHLEDWFDDGEESPYMLFTASLREDKRILSTEEPLDLQERLQQKRSEIPAVTHVDFSARLQTVTEKHNPLLYKLIHLFYEKTGCPMLINTSFNVRGEPIVCSPTDAFQCFMGTDMDILVIGSSLLVKREQKAGRYIDQSLFLKRDRE